MTPTHPDPGSAPPSGSGPGSPPQASPDPGSTPPSVPGPLLGTTPPLPPGDPPEALLRTMGRRIRWGAGIAFVAALGLGFGTELSLLHAVALPLFLVLFPTAALAQTPLLRHIRFERIPAYLQSGFTILVMGGLALGLVAMGPGAEAAGIATLPVLDFLAWTAGLTLGCLLLSLGFRPLELRAWERAPEGRGAEGEGTLADGMIDALLPRTAEERRLFAGLSLAAGWGEEMAYRGYVPAALVLAGLGPWTAMAGAALAFGVLHAYQGPVGVVRTGVVGFLLGVSVILTGSLFPAMVAHALLDLILGLVVGPRLLADRAPADRNSADRTPAAPDPADRDPSDRPS